MGSISVVKNNKNLFNINEVITELSEGATIDDEDWITISGNNTNGSQPQYINFFTEKSNILKNSMQYYLVFEVKNVSGTGMIAPFSTSDSNYESQFVYLEGKNRVFSELRAGSCIMYQITAKSTFENSETMLRTFCGFDPEQSGSITFRLSVLENKPDMETFVYVPQEAQLYTVYTQQPFRSINNIRDTFIKINDKWYERHYIARKIFNGTENIDGLENMENCFYYLEDNMLNASKVLSSHFTENRVSTIAELKNDEISTTAGTGAYIWMKMNITTVAEFKSFLAERYASSNPIYVDYVLKEPLLLECTAEQTAQLEALHNSKNYKNGTIIYSTDEVSPQFDVTYTKDLDTVRANDKAELQSQIDEIKALLSTTNTSAMLLDNMQAELESEVE